FAADNYRDYLEVHGLSVQLTEALAEAWHRRVRDELRLPEGAVSDEDPDAIHDYLDLKYRGARYSFGYGACADLESRQVAVDLLETQPIGVELCEDISSKH